MKHSVLTYLSISLAACLPISLAYGQTQICNQNITNAWPDSRYTDHGDGTATDTQTGLMWMQCSEGQTYTSNSCSNTVTLHSWKAALELASNKNFAGHNDWRLPNIKELGSLVARNCADPSINATVFPNTPVERFWSSSPYAYNSSNSRNAWGVFFYNGADYTDVRNGDFGVRLVR